MRAIIFVNGELTEPQVVRELLQPDDYLIAVNGGTRHALSIGVVPHVIIGDLDSLAPADRVRATAAGARLLSFSPNKDETDLELALRHAIAQGAAEIVIVAALGGRLDQTCANLFLLTLPELKGRRVSIREGRQTAFLICDKAEIKGKPGDLVSILPIAGDAVGVSNEGFEWPLHDETLPLGTTRGISNVLLSEQASIRVRAGMLLCVVTRAAIRTELILMIEKV